MLPKRRKPEKMGCREPGVIRNESHKKWVRGFECAAAGKLDPCSGRMEAAHARNGTDGGTGFKPSDCWVIPLCFYHHEIVQHSKGEPEFERRYGIDMKKMAAELWRISPHRFKSEQP